MKVNSLKNIYVYHLELEFCGMEVIKVLNIQNLSLRYVRCSQVYLSLFGFPVFAFTLDICFYFENTRAKVHWRLQRFSHVSTEFKIIQLKI